MISLVSIQLQLAVNSKIILERINFSNNEIFRDKVLLTTKEFIILYTNFYIFVSKVASKSDLIIFDLIQRLSFPQQNKTFN